MNINQKVKNLVVGASFLLSSNLQAEDKTKNKLFENFEDQEKIEWIDKQDKQKDFYKFDKELPLPTADEILSGLEKVLTTEQYNTIKKYVNELINEPVMLAERIELFNTHIAIINNNLSGEKANVAKAAIVALYRGDKFLYSQLQKNLGTEAGPIFNDVFISKGHLGSILMHFKKEEIKKSELYTDKLNKDTDSLNQNIEKTKQSIDQNKKILSYQEVLGGAYSIMADFSRGQSLDYVEKKFGGKEKIKKSLTDYYNIMNSEAGKAYFKKYPASIRTSEDIKISSPYQISDEEFAKVYPMYVEISVNSLKEISKKRDLGLTFGK